MNDKQNARLAEERLFLIEKFGPLLFFLIPLIILIVGGKEGDSQCVICLSGNCDSLYWRFLSSQKTLSSLSARKC